MTSTRAYRIPAVLLAWVILRGQVPGFAETGEDRIYWADMNGIYWSDLKEGNTQRIVSADTRRPGKIAVDVAGGKMYWIDKRGETIQRSDLDGSNSEWLIGPQGYGSANDLDLDLDRRKIYFSTRTTNTDAVAGGVYRANLDGSDIELLEMGWPRTLLVDSARDLVYLTDGYGIYLLDREGHEYVLESRSTRSQRDVALDLVNDKVYWTDPEERAIRRSDRDGSNVEDVLTELADTPGEIALDPEGGKVYWTLLYDAGYRYESYGGLRRANLDGSDVEHVVDRGEVVGFILDLEGGKVYWTDARGTIHRAEFDGTGVEDLFAPLVRAPYSVALDQTEGRIYWSDVLTGSIQRAGLDGSSPEIAVGELRRPRGIVLDGDRLYWADSGTGKIQSADLKGASVMDIATELDDPDKVAVDPAHRRIYWTEPGRSLIRRADLDGTHIEEYPVESAPDGLALDVAGGKMYWTRTKGRIGGHDRPTGISRSSLDGTDVEHLSGDIENVEVVGDLWVHDFRAVALDPAGGKIYWTSVNNPPVVSPYTLWAYRANLDGSGAERMLVLQDHWGYQRSGLKVWPPALMGNALALDFSRRTAVSAGNSVPLSTTLLTSYPNPFNASTLISYTLAASGPVSLIIYNTLGQPVQTLIDKIQVPGRYSVPWQPAEALASGVYLYRLTTPGAVLTRRLALVR